MNLSGNPTDYFLAFFGGILASFTPCVLPLIPVSAGYIGIRAGESRTRSILLGVVYVTGLAVAYSALGLVASLTGSLFGQIASSPVVHIAIGLLIVIFGLAMAGVLHLPLPVVSREPALIRKGYLSVFVLGLSSAFLVSPCVTPMLGSILAYLATKRNVFYGSTLLFVFAYGMGFTLIIMGFFAELLIHIRKFGRWTVYIQKIIAFFLIVMGLYSIYDGIRSMML